MTTRITVWDRDEFLAAQRDEIERSELEAMRNEINRLQREIAELEAALTAEESGGPPPNRA